MMDGKVDFEVQMFVLDFDPAYYVGDRLRWANRSTSDFSFSTDVWQVSDDTRVVLDIVQGLPEELPDYFAVGPLKIASAEFVRVMTEFDADAEYIPATLGQDSLGFYGLHLRPIAGAIDMALSVVEEEIGPLKSGVKKLVLSEEATQNSHLFTLPTLATPIVVSESVRVRISETALRGLRCTPVSEYRETGI